MDFRLWLWQYTDQFGKRRVTRYRLSEGEARERLRDPVKLEGSLMNREGDRVDRRLSAIAAEVLTGKHFQCAWELCRLQHFPGWDHEEVAAALGAWSTRHGIRVGFEGRTVRDLPVIYVCFGA